jgi:hypothetical protein
MAAKSAKSKKTKSSKPQKKSPVKKPAPKAWRAAKTKAPGKKSAVLKKPAVKAKQQVPKPASGKAKMNRDLLLEKISAMAATLEEGSLAKLLQDAVILAHNERVLRNFMAAKGQAAQRGPAVLADIEEGKDGTFFIAILNGQRNIFGLEEMRAFVKLCHGADNAVDAAPRIYAWMERERLDILKNSKIDSEKDPSLPALWEKVVATYGVKE